MKAPDPAEDDSAGWVAAARRWRISGRVQGVGYRAFAARAGRALNLSGGARNLVDGQVEVNASGAIHALDRLEAALGEGTSLSRVSRVDVEVLSAPLSPADLAACDVEF
ncbi:MAG TPA: acylphosphatase [Thermoanaerobaculia bacterium]|nr:acylphosphatase [Thermoanaerobaculia bacterium]